MSLHRRVGVSVLVLLSVATALFLSPTSSTESSDLSVEPAAGTAGMMAYIDPETGQLTTGPRTITASELDEETQNALRRDSEGLEVVRHADGSESVDLQGRFQHVSMVKIDENGNLTICTDNADAAAKLNSQPVNPNTPEVK